MGIVGFSSEFTRDDRVRAVGFEARLLWMESVMWVSRGGVQPLTPEDLDYLCELIGVGAAYATIHAEDLSEAGLWRGDPGSGWEVVENGLWTLDPDAEPDVLGDGPDAFLE